MSILSTINAFCLFCGTCSKNMTQDDIFNRPLFFFAEHAAHSMPTHALTIKIHLILYHFSLIVKLAILLIM